MGFENMLPKKGDKGIKRIFKTAAVGTFLGMAMNAADVDANINKKVDIKKPTKPDLAQKLTQLDLDELRGDVRHVKSSELLKINNGNGRMLLVEDDGKKENTIELTQEQKDTIKNNVFNFVGDKIKDKTKLEAEIKKWEIENKNADNSDWASKRGKLLIDGLNNIASHKDGIEIEYDSPHRAIMSLQIDNNFVEFVFSLDSKFNVVEYKMGF
jgi:hypothetical protein